MKLREAALSRAIADASAKPLLNKQSSTVGTIFFHGARPEVVGQVDISVPHERASSKSGH